MKFKNILLGMALTMFFTSCGGEKTDETTSDESTGDSTEVVTDGVDEAKGASGTYSVDTATSTIGWKGYQKLQKKEHNGTIKLSEGTLTLENGTVVAGSFTVDMNTIINLDMAESPEMKAKLEGHLKSPDFFDVENNPTATFEVTSVDGSVATGDLTIKDRTQEVEVTDVSVEETDGLVNVTGKLTFNRANFEVKYGSGTFFEKLGDNVIDDNIDLTISISAKSAE